MYSEIRLKVRSKLLSVSDTVYFKPAFGTVIWKIIIVIESLLLLPSQMAKQICFQTQPSQNLYQRPLNPCIPQTASSNVRLKYWRNCCFEKIRINIRHLNPSTKLKNGNLSQMPSLNPQSITIAVTNIVVCLKIRIKCTISYN